MKKILPLALLMLTGCITTCPSVIARTATVQVIEVKDGQSFLPAACGATVELLKNGVVVWSESTVGIESCEDDMVFTPHVGSGTYTVTVTKDGYDSWQGEITSTSLGECGAITSDPKVIAFLKSNS